MNYRLIWKFFLFFWIANTLIKLEITYNELLKISLSDIAKFFSSFENKSKTFLFYLSGLDRKFILDEQKDGSVCFLRIWHELFLWWISFSYIVCVISRELFWHWKCTCKNVSCSDFKLFFDVMAEKVALLDRPFLNHGSAKSISH